jgi:thiamine biosynthesis lipoprotein
MRYRFHQGPIQGTEFHITYEWHEDLSEEIDSLLQTFNAYLSNYDPNSIISQINNNVDVEINKLIAEMIQTSQEIYENTGGAFDITVAPLANAWGFGWSKDNDEKIPGSATIDSIMQYVGMNKIQVSGNKIFKTNPNVTIIGNAIAQGLSADYISDYFIERGLRNFLVEIGGEVFCHGLGPVSNNHWRVGIDKPVEGSGYGNRESQLIVALSGKGIATSGNYRKFIKEGEQKLGHSIDPRTGYPAQNSLLSVSVVSKSAMISDGYATAFMVMGLEASLSLAEQIEDLEAFFIYTDENGEEKTMCTSGFENYIYNSASK